jgi:uncharacterized membrane protein (UPF0127 family)
MRRARIVIEPAGIQIAVADIADTSISRMIGLLGRANLETGTGLVLKPCNMIHTWFMRFPIDVLFVSDEGIVVRALEALRPFRLAWGGSGASQTIELPAGTLGRLGIRSGERVRMEPV